MTTTSTSKHTQLSKAKLTTTSIVLLVVAALAPLTVLAGGVPTNYAVSGLNGVPGTFLLLGVVFLIFTVGYGRMSSRIQNSGALYAYISEGLGNRQGIAAAILALVSYNMMQVGLFGMFGFSGANLVEALTGVSVPWWVVGGLGWLIIGFLGMKNVDFSAKVVGVIVVLGVAIVLVVAVLGLLNAPEGITADGFLPGQIATPGIGVLLAFTLAAFMGFESGAIYSEETVDPERTIPKATYIAVVTIAVFYAVTSWAFTMGIGPSAIIDESVTYGPNLMFLFLESYSPALSYVAQLLFVLSLLAALIAFHNAVARYFFALGRARILPAFFGKASDDGAPVGGSVAQSLIAVTVVAVFVLAGFGSELGDLYPVLTLFTWMTNGAAFGVVCLLALTGIAILVWARREDRDAGLWRTTIAPAVSAAGLIVVAVLVVVNFDLMIGDTGPASLRWVMPGLIVATGLVGVVVGERLKRRRPEIYNHLHEQLDRIEG